MIDRANKRHGKAIRAAMERKAGKRKMPVDDKELLERIQESSRLPRSASAEMRQANIRDLANLLYPDSSRMAEAFAETPQLQLDGVSLVEVAKTYEGWRIARKIIISVVGM